MLVSLVLPGAVAKFRHPAFGRAISRTRIHQSIDNDHTDNSIGVSFHCLQQTIDKGHSALSSAQSSFHTHKSLTNVALQVQKSN